MYILWVKLIVYRDSSVISTRKQHARLTVCTKLLSKKHTAARSHTEQFWERVINSSNYLLFIVAHAQFMYCGKYV